MGGDTYRATMPARVPPTLVLRKEQEMGFLERCIDKAKAMPQRVAFPEGSDPTMKAGAARVASEGIANCVLVGNRNELQKLASERGYDRYAFSYSDLEDASETDSIAERYALLPNALFTRKGIARRCGRDALLRSMAMLAVGDVDVVFAGIGIATADVISAAQQVVGLTEGATTPTSVVVMDVPGWEGSAGSLLAVGDAGVCVEPTVEQLAEIAVSCADTFSALADVTPRIAMLSHSTVGSAQNDLARKVAAATELVRERRPDLKVDGEMQVDAALSSSGAQKKMGRESEVAGQANVLVVPTIDVGNIMCKMVRFLAHSKNYGPMLQGFPRIVCDCSRSATVDDIVGNVVLGCLRAQALH